LDWIEKANQCYTNFELEVQTLRCLRKRKDKRKPIDDNPEAIDFIYSIIK
jgi:hypothetical protein